MAVIKAQENLKMKPKDIAKIEQKQEKTNAAYLIAADGYEYQLELTNNRIFEAYNIIFPDLLTVCSILIHLFPPNGSLITRWTI